MAAAIPLVGSFLAAGSTMAGVGAALTGAAGFASFATVAGGIMASAGMLTGNKTLAKLGGIMGVAGMASSLASSLVSGASTAAEGVASDALAGKAGESAASQALAEGASNASNAVAAEPLGKLGQSGIEAASESAGGQALTLEQPGANLMEQVRAGRLDASDYGLMSRNAAQPAPFQQTQAGAMVTDGSDYGMAQRGLSKPSFLVENAQDQALSRIAEAGQQIPNRTALDTLLDKLKGAGQWIKDNKELAMVGGNMLAGGLQAYQQGQQFDAQMNLLEQRRRRLNSPVALGIQPVTTNPLTPGG